MTDKKDTNPSEITGRDGRVDSIAIVFLYIKMDDSSVLFNYEDLLDMKSFNLLF